MLGLGIKEVSREWKYRHHYWSERIKSGKVQGVLDDIWKNMRNRLGKDAMREFKYYRGNAGRMKYDEYRANGWFIGSGVIKSRCRTVIGQRFKQSGMLWSLKGAKALLPLRTLYKSNRLDEFFNHLEPSRQGSSTGRLRGMSFALCVLCGKNPLTLAHHKYLVAPRQIGKSGIRGIPAKIPNLK